MLSRRRFLTGAAAAVVAAPLAVVAWREAVVGMDFGFQPSKSVVMASYRMGKAEFGAGVIDRYQHQLDAMRYAMHIRPFPRPIGKTIRFRRPRAYGVSA